MKEKKAFCDRDSGGKSAAGTLNGIHTVSTKALCFIQTIICPLYNHRLIILIVEARHANAYGNSIDKILIFKQKILGIPSYLFCDD